MAPARRSARLSSLTTTSSSTSPIKSPAKTTTTRQTSSSRPNKKQQQHYEFGGPLGTTAMLAGLPLVCYALVASCNPRSGCSSLDPRRWASPFDLVPLSPSPSTSTSTSSSSSSSSLSLAVVLFKSFVAVSLWFVAQVLLHLVLPGPKIKGVVLSNGKRLEYKLNGFKNLLATLAAALTLGLRENPATKEPWLALCYDYYVPLLTGAVAFSTLLSVGLYAASFRRGGGGGKGGGGGGKGDDGEKNNDGESVLLSSHGASGCAVYDFFMGRELNPRFSFSTFDWKEFCELYPGLIGWVVLDLGCAAKQWAMMKNRNSSSTFGGVLFSSLFSSSSAAASTTQQSPLFPSASMLLVCLFHALYVADALWHEPAILTTMDITSDGFGFMLAFGDLAWVPFTYSLQARYLVDFPNELSSASIVLICALNAVAYAVFRGSNSQKDAFRRDPHHPSVAHLETIETSTGRKLLVSGWWGVARHVNYFGDWLLGWSWCLPCGFRHVVPYFYVAYFAGLLLHRDRRDGDACAKKYGKDWDRYCERVRWRIIPFVY